MILVFIIGLFFGAFITASIMYEPKPDQDRERKQLIADRRRRCPKHLGDGMYCLKTFGHRGPHTRYE